MNTELAISQPQTAIEMKQHVQRIQQVMKAVMKKDVHYGVVPGTPKPSLWKPGAEVLCSAFRIAPTYRIADLSDGDCVRYRVTCIGTHQGTGVVLGEGMGEASSNEEKYKWRAAKVTKEFDETPEDRRRVKYGRGDRGDYEINQVRTEPADQANTVLKMACKRAQVAMTLNVTAASDIFSQDLEDYDTGGGGGAPGGGERKTGKPETERPRAAGGSGGGAKATERQVKLLRARLDAASVDAKALCDQFGIESLPDLPFDKVNESLDWIGKHAAGAPNAAG